MTLNLGKSKFSLHKKALVFLGIVPILLVTAWVPATCPACHGSGEISNYGMAGVTLVERPSVRKSFSWNIVCGSYLMYQMEIVLTLQNDGDQDAYGFVELYMTDPISNYQSDVSIVAVSVSAGNVAQIIVAPTFTIPREYSKSQLPIVEAKVQSDYCPCKECNGTGKVALNSWGLSKKRWGLHSTKTLVWEHAAEAPPFLDLEGWGFVIWIDEDGNEIELYVDLGDWYADNPQ